MRRSSFALIAALVAGGTAFAQTDGAKKQDETPTFEDLKNSLGDLQEKQSREETEKRDAIVQRNHEDTLKIYSDTLGKRNGELQNVVKRLEINKQLHAKYTKLLEQARSDLAVTRSQFVNRTMALKKSIDDGKLSRDAYEKLVDEDTKRFRNREKELLEDVAFQQEEIQTAARLVKDLQVKKELMEFDPFGGEETGSEEAAPKKARLSIADRVQKTIAEMSGYRNRSVVDTLK